jgi:cbb3-type cytochrome oxidase maturation protein
MSVLFVVLPLAILFSGLAVTAFLWSTRSGQLDDLETPPLRILGDDANVRVVTFNRVGSRPEPTLRAPGRAPGARR